MGVGVGRAPGPRPYPHKDGPGKGGPPTDKEVALASHPTAKSHSGVSADVKILWK